MDTYKYGTTCSMCETKLELVVHGEDEFPVFCSMCGTEIDYEMIEDE